MNKSSPQGTQDVCTIFLFIMDFNPGVFQQQLNRVQLYKSTISICKTHLALSAPIEMRQQSSTYINLYHKQQHQPCTNLCQTTCTIKKCIQPCTKYIPIMCQLLINNYSSICTNIINYTPHVSANSSTACLNHDQFWISQRP